MYKLIKYIIFFLFANAIWIYAEDDMQNLVTHQYWFDYNPDYYFSNKMKLENQIGIQTATPYDWTTFLISSTLNYNLPKFFWDNLNYRAAVQGGLEINYTTNVNSNNRLEVRPFQAYVFEYPRFIAFTINHHLRLEERFDMDAENWVNTFGLRFRYKAQIITRFSASFVNLPNYFFIPVYIEFFWDMLKAKQFNDVRRLMIGFGYEFTNTMNASFIFGYNNTRHDVNESFSTNDIVFRFRFFHYFNPPQ